MKKTLIVVAMLLLGSSAKVMAQNLTVVNTNTCVNTGGLIIDISGGDASGCGTAGINMNFDLSSSGWGPENIFDFNRHGAGPLFWDYGTVGTGAMWDVTQIYYPGVSPSVIASPYYPCAPLTQTTTIFTGTCYFTVDWDEDVTTHDVTLKIHD